jgi:hypothetical protein
VRSDIVPANLIQGWAAGQHSRCTRTVLRKERCHDGKHDCSCD